MWLKITKARVAGLALVALAVAAAVTVALVRRRRTPAADSAPKAEPFLKALRQRELEAVGQRDASQQAGGTAGGGGSSEAGKERWPPVPVLGRPTADDLARYDTPPPRVPDLSGLPPLPRLPEEPRARRKVLRWTTAAAALCALFVLAQWLDDAVFGRYEMPVGTSYYVDQVETPGMRIYEGEPCLGYVQTEHDLISGCGEED